MDILVSFLDGIYISKKINGQKYIIEITSYIKANQERNTYSVKINNVW